MKSPLFIVFMTSHCILLNGMNYLSPQTDYLSPHYLTQYAKSISRYHQQKIKEFDDDCENIWKERLTINQFMDNISNLVTTYEQRTPFFLMDDCAQEKCILARHNNQHLRATFEKKASLLLQKKIVAHPDRSINYTSFCVSGILPELIILTKTLLRY